MSPIALLLAYCVLIALASWLGGYVPIKLRLGHTAMQTLMSAVAGFMFGVALLHMLGHALPDVQPIADGTQSALLWLLAGFLVMFFTERFFAFHVHDTDHAEAMLCDGDHPEQAPETHAHHHHHPHEHGPKLSWTGATVGMTVHSLIAGVALGSAMATGLTASGGTEGASPGSAFALVGLPVFLAIVLHKPLDALTIIALAKSSGLSPAATHRLNFAFAWVVPVGIVASYFGLTSFFADRPEVLAYALAFSAGTFICVALSDLLPEVQFHQHDRVKLSAALLVGLALAWGVGVVEHALGEDHHNHQHAAPAPQEPADPHARHDH